MKRATRKGASKRVEAFQSEEQLIDGMQPELRRLCMRALLLHDRQAASEVLTRAIEVQEYLIPILLHEPVLLADELQQLFAVPVLVAFRPSHPLYHQKVIKHLRKLKVGAKTGVACDERARWKSSGSVGSLATLLYDTAEALRSGNVHPLRGDLRVIVRWVEAENPEIKSAAQSPAPFTQNVDDWIQKICRPLLFMFRPDLKPGEQGRRKRGDTERTDPRKKNFRDKIIARLRDMAARPGDKSHF